MTFEEQQTWACIRETGYFWRGRWVKEDWVWNCEESMLVRERVDEHWETIVAVAEGEKEPKALPAAGRKTAVDAPPPSAMDDEIPF